MLRRAPVDAARASTDAELAALVGAGSPGPVELVGGDLWRTLGGSTTAPTVQLLPVDVLAVELDGVATTAVAHVVVKRPGRRGWWSGPIVGVLNVGTVGAWDVAPRAHPNDGRLDLVEVAATMPVRARLQARRRLATGTHVPHPAITTRQRTDVDLAFDEPLEVRVDGSTVGRARHVRVTVAPDACTVYA